MSMLRSDEQRLDVVEYAVDTTLCFRSNSIEAVDSGGVKGFMV
jgi:hypothetical protein